MDLIGRITKNPITRKRIQRLKEMKRAYISLWIVSLLYVVSFGAELICNDAPLYVKYNGQSYFPVFKFYPDHTFTGSGRQTRPDYHLINSSNTFARNPENYMVFPPIAFGPYASVNPDLIDVPDVVTVRFKPVPVIGTVNVRRDYTIARSVSFGTFIAKSDREARRLKLTDYFKIPAGILQAVATRFQNESAPAVTAATMGPDGKEITISLSTFSQRKKPPKTVRLKFEERPARAGSDAQQVQEIEFDRELNPTPTLPAKGGGSLWATLTEDVRQEILRNVQTRFSDLPDDIRIMTNAGTYSASFDKEDIRFPFRPVKGHIMGIDGAGRDVFARILYGLRTSMTFGLLLVLASMVLGIVTGALQGYYGGAVDISGQRLIEIWSALPFLYIMILMGSVYGRSFPLLLVCYGMFNWIGISYYMRAEFLRLRKQPFVEAAKCMGIASHKIIFKHILPNGLVPVVTFFPFSLVGAIGALAALDYLGFGLPPPTPSWGELLFQAQQFRWAWWLILYPSLALFTVMLLGVFVGEGVRNAYDPKRYQRLE